MVYTSNKTILFSIFFPKFGAGRLLCLFLGFLGVSVWAINSPITLATCVDNETSNGVIFVVENIGMDNQTSLLENRYYEPNEARMTEDRFYFIILRFPETGRRLVLRVPDSSSFIFIYISLFYEILFIVFCMWEKAKVRDLHRIK